MVLREKATKVLYEVSDAVKKLGKLDKKVTDSGKKAKKGFKEASTGVEEFDNKINDLRGRLETMRGKLTAVKAGVGGAGIAFGVAAGAIIGATAAVLDFTNGLRDGDAVLGDYLASARAVREEFDALSTSEDARRNFQFLAAKEAIALQREELTNRQIASDAAKDQANEAVSTEKSKLSRIQSALRSSHRSTLDAEKRLAEKRKELAGDSNEFSGQAAGRRVGSLASKAKQLAKSGRVEEAEALIEKAKELSTELGNHKFFTDQIDSANGAVVKALEKNVKTSKKEESTLQQKLTSQQKVVTAAEEEAAQQKVISKQISNQIKLLGVKSGLVSAQRKLERQLQSTDQGAREVTSAQAGIQNEAISQANVTAFVRGMEIFRDSIKRLSLRTGFGSGQDIDRAQALQKRAQELAIKSAKATTPGQIEETTGERAAIVEEFKAIEIGIKDGSINAVVERTLSQIKPLIEGSQAVRDAGGKLGAVGENETIQAAQIRQRAAADEAQAQVGEIAQKTVNYNVKVEGGMIDEKTIAELEKRLTRRERKGTSTSKE